MGRWLATLGTVIAICAGNVFAADELPKSDPDESFEVEPPVLIPNRDRDADPNATAATSPVPVDLERLERNLERAKRSAGGADHLYRIGVLAKVEVEQRILRMIRLQAEVGNARLALAKEEFAAREKSLAAGEISKEQFKETEAALARSISVAHAAVAQRERAEIDAAEANLRRQRQLLSVGIGRKSEVARAEEKLAELKAQKN